MFSCKTFSALIIAGFLIACNAPKAKQPPPFLPAGDAILLNQLVYKDTLKEAIARYAPAYEIVFLPAAVNGNFAFIAKQKATEQYALVIRGSMIEFSNEGFQNFILQDFNIFTIKPWAYVDTVKEAYISNGAWIGFQNLLQLKDGNTGLTVKEFIEQKIPSMASIIITGHSLGGNLAYPLAGYLKKEITTANKNNLQLITFGAPAAGNATFVKDLDEKFPAGERYATDKDIAVVFPDMSRIQELAALTGLDSVLQLDKLNINGVSAKLDGGTLLKIAGEILRETNVINETNSYVQSQKHLRLLKDKNLHSPGTPSSAEDIFNRAYQFHKVDMYAILLGGKALE